MIGTMNTYTGNVLKIVMGEDGRLRVVISCPEKALPSLGQYIQAHRLADTGAVTSISLFPGDSLPEAQGDGMFALTIAPPIPNGWQPGDELFLRGPLGKGFKLPVSVLSLALAGLGESISRLLPLAYEVINSGGEVALFTDASLPRLPTQVEANPLDALPDALSWADFLALDGPPEVLSGLGELVKRKIKCPAQILVYIPMPCGGMADCGVCAVGSNKGKYKLACVDGPVFDLSEVKI
jgi:NAD(P)H-flavin reductase